MATVPISAFFAAFPQITHCKSTKSFSNSLHIFFLFLSDKHLSYGKNK